MHKLYFTEIKNIPYAPCKRYDIISIKNAIRMYVVKVCEISKFIDI